MTVLLAVSEVDTVVNTVMLTDTQIKQTKPKERGYKVADSGGLYLFISVTGTKSWRYDYRFHGRRETLTIGKYPAVSLKDARDLHAEAQKCLAKGKSPALTKRREKFDAVAAAADSFHALAEQWFNSKSAELSVSWRKTARAWLDNDIYPVLGTRSLGDILPADVLEVMRRFEERGALNSAEKARSLMSQIFRFGIRNMRTDFDVAQAVRGAVNVPRMKHHPTLNEQQLPDLLTKIKAYSGDPTTRLAFRLLLLTFVRKMELAKARWDEVYFKKAEWRIPAERMKMGEPHVVPLSQQGLECFTLLRALAGSSVFVFPHRSDPRKHMGPSRLNDALRIMGYQGRFSPHGARALASTVLNEQGWRPDVIERQLAHTERNKVRASYNRAEYLEERRDMMQVWANYLDKLRIKADDAPILESA